MKKSIYIRASKNQGIVAFSEVLFIVLFFFGHFSIHKQLDEFQSQLS